MNSKQFPFPQFKSFIIFTLLFMNQILLPFGVICVYLNLNSIIKKPHLFKISLKKLKKLFYNKYTFKLIFYKNVDVKIYNTY